MNSDFFTIIDIYTHTLIEEYGLPKEKAEEYLLTILKSRFFQTMMR
jgi:hypothetical protein